MCRDREENAADLAFEEAQRDAEMEEIQCSAYRGPMAAYGFRSGEWSFTFRGKEYTVYLSIPASLDMNEQERRLRRACWAELGNMEII